MGAPKRRALEWHLRNNFVPPYNRRLMPFVLRAIALARQGSMREQIVIQGDLGQTKTKTVEEMVDDFRLEEFIR